MSDIMDLVRKLAEKEMANMRTARYFKHWGEVARYVQMHTEISVTDKGKLWVTTKFSNGDRSTPRNMAVTINLLDGNGALVYLVYQEAHGVGTTGGFGSAKEVVKSDFVQISPEQSSMIVSTTASHSQATKKAREQADKALSDLLKKSQPDYPKDKD